MDRVLAQEIDDESRTRPSPPEAIALPSRGAALDACRAAIAAGHGPILVTGEAGAGKTWLWRRLAADRADGRRWLAIDLAPTTDPADLFRAIGHGLGLAEPPRPREGRRLLADFLAEEAQDGHRWVLVVDEAHNASDVVLEELRLLSNRLGQPDGFAALLLVGQTRLARRVESPDLVALEARIGARVHLRPIDADEARDLIAHHDPSLTRDLALVEGLHRDSAGNPRRLLRLSATARPPGTTLRLVAPEPLGSPPMTVVPTTGQESRLGVIKPPIRVEDGLIEVGWDGIEAEPPRPSPGVVEPPRPSARVGAGAGPDEIINDHYAALQAWNEWARNQERQPALLLEPVTSPLDDEAPVDRADPSSSDRRPVVWPDEPHGFAPYSQLFSRLSQANDPE